MRLPFHTLDVFTEKAFEGNPLAVVLEADGLDAARMQAIAREFNLSETVFVLTPRDPVNAARIRIFTPARELPFAGHPTVGAAVLLAALRAPEIIARQDLGVVLEEEVGPVTCTVRRVRGATRASFEVPRRPVMLDGAIDRAAAAAALGLAAADIGFGAHRAPSRASAGVPFIFVPLAGPEAAARARPAAGPAWTAAFGDTDGVYLYTRATRQGGATLHARMFAPALGMAEDPATGAAAAALAAVLAHFDAPPAGDHTEVIAQGIEMGRPSLLTLGLTMAAGELAGASLAGAAVAVSEGWLTC